MGKGACRISGGGARSTVDGLEGFLTLGGQGGRGFVIGHESGLRAQGDDGCAGVQCAPAPGVHRDAAGRVARR